MRRDPREDRRFASKTLIATAIVLAVVLILLLARTVASVLLVVFAGVLLAVFLDGLAMVIEGLTGMRRGGALAIAILLFFGFFVASVWLVGPPVGSQIAKLAERLPSAVESVRTYLSELEWGRSIVEWMPETNQLLSMSTDVLKGVGGFFWGAAGLFVNAIFVLFIGIYMAVSPSLYVDNFVRLFPIPKRRRIREVFSALGVALRWWLVGRAASMAVVGVLTALGLWIAGVPQPLALALIAALMAFVPFLGPVLGAIPAVLVALAESPIKTLYVVLVFTIVQLLENYFITPLIQQRAVSMAPALLITVQIVMGILFGAAGVLLATPLAVVFIVVVQMLYIHDVLGDRMRLLGEK
jgi:predicted PurR-regulated permease PerM